MKWSTVYDAYAKLIAKGDKLPNMNEADTTRISSRVRHSARRQRSQSQRGHGGNRLSEGRPADLCRGVKDNKAM